LEVFSMTLLQASHVLPAHAATASPLQAEGSTRDRIVQLLAERAWTPSELGAALGVDRKTADYHLHALRRGGIAAEREVHGQRRFALARGAPRAFAQARPARSRYRVALAVEQRGLVGLDELAREVGLSRSLTAYHVRNLAAQRIVRVRRLGHRVVVQAQGLAVQAQEPAIVE
jgi:predicted transcriptional regulator